MGARERGEVTHRLLEHMPLSWAKDAQADCHWEALAGHLGLPWEAQLSHWLERFWKSEVGALFSGAGEEGVLREVPFSWAIPGESASEWVLFLRGQMDVLLRREEGHYLIIDYKTGAAENPEAYALQLACYRNAVLHWKKGAHVQAGVVFLREELPRLHCLDEKKLAVYDAAFLRKIATNILDARASGVWPMRNLKECQAMGCPYILFCYSA
jgi:ATP-dependent exoDNAse (exonuclease V) beta subunit